MVGKNERYTKVRTALFEDEFASEHNGGVLFPEGKFLKNYKKGMGSVLYFSKIFLSR